MSYFLKKMVQEGKVIETHPTGTFDLSKLNQMLKLHPDYIEGVEFTFAENIGHNQVQFYYDHPDSFTEEQAEVARVLVANVKNDFMCSKKT